LCKPEAGFGADLWTRSLLNGGQHWVAANFCNNVHLINTQESLEKKLAETFGWAKDNLKCIVFDDITGISNELVGLFAHVPIDKSVVTNQHNGKQHL
jgi:hypothetical protein